MSRRIGFCCKWQDPKRDKAAEELVNQKTTTISALSKLNGACKQERIEELLRHNLSSLEILINVVGSLPDDRKLLRLTSDLLPGYTHEVAKHLYQKSSVRALMERGFARVGALARSHDVRLGFHPGQYCLLNNDNPGIYQRAVEEFEMHVDIMRWMGYANGWHPHGAHINIHVGGKAGGIMGFIRGLKGISEDGRNLITVENDEFSFGLDDLEPLAEHCPIVTDIYHHWINSNGEYLQADDACIKDYIIPSWRGVRPLGHFSQPRQMLIPQHSPNLLPDYAAMKARGISDRDIKGHSDYCWNNAMNAWAISHLTWMDLEVEAKCKNLASEQVYEQFKL